MYKELQDRATKADCVFNGPWEGFGGYLFTDNQTGSTFVIQNPLIESIAEKSD